MMRYEQVEGWWCKTCAEMYQRAVIEAPDPAHFVEVGSWLGRSAACMAEMLESSAKLIRFDCVDTWLGSPYGSHPGRRAELESQGTTLYEEFERNLRRCNAWRYVNPVRLSSVEAANHYEDESLDMVMIDADHRPEAVEADVRAWLPKLKPGAMLCGHDAANRGVMAGIAAAGVEPNSKGMVWWYHKPKRAYRDPSTVTVYYPAEMPGVKRAWPYLLEGFKRLGCRVHLSKEIQRLGAWSPPARLPDPVHVAVIEIDNRLVWYDVSDFTPSSPSLGQPYFAKNALIDDWPLVRPIGQYLGTAPDEYWRMLPELRDETEEKTIWRLAVYSNIDEPAESLPNQYHAGAELHRPRMGHRLKLVERLHETGARDSCYGLWRWGRLRPQIPAHLRVEPIHYTAHWRRIAKSRVVYCLPGVGGESTRLRTEALGIGSCVVTVETRQTWPGNWHGCWIEAKPTPDDLIAAGEIDGEEAERVGRLGRWYYETNLTPEAMALRVLREVV